MEHQKHAYLVLFFAGFLVVVLFSFLIITPHFTGRIIADGGKITQVNIEGQVSAGLWAGVYGNISAVGAASSVVGSGDLLHVDLSYGRPYTSQTVIVASLANLSSWMNVTPAPLSMVDAFLGVGPGNEESAENTLMERVNFTINGQVLELWSATTMSSVGTYQTGALLIDGSLSFVTKPTAGLGFDGSLVDYQLLLPVPSAANYSFFIFEQGSIPGSALWCNVSSNLSAVLAPDNASVILSWSAMPGAASYEVLSLDGPTMGQLDFSGAANVSVAGTSWTDSAPGEERYYRLRASDGTSACVLNGTAGTMLLDLSPDYNLVSTPFIDANQSVGETLRSIAGSYSEVLVLNNSDKNYHFYLLVGSNIFKDFDAIAPGQGYWIRTTENVSLRLAGRLASTVQASLSPDYNLVGFPVIDNSLANETIPYILTSINGSYSEVLALNNDQKSYNFYLLVGNSVFKDFESIRPGMGYWIRTSQNVTLEYQNG